MAEYIECNVTCKNCIHYDVCYHIEHYGRELETDKPCEQFKSSDMVDIIRCKDCKNCDSFYPNKKIGEEPELVYFCKIEHHATGADDFCSCGKKKKNLSLKDKQRFIDKVTKK